MGIDSSIDRKSTKALAVQKQTITSRKRESNPDEDRGLIAIGIVCLIGILAIVFVCIWSASKKVNGSFWPVMGLSAMVALCSLIVGGFLGFLFGIPRSLQRGSVSNEGNDFIKGTNTRPYSNNTNLEQISDWLTKIIVGVSLTQLPAISRNFSGLTSSVSSGFDSFIDKNLAIPYAGSLIIFYSVCGFLAVYLWAKIYLLQQLTIMDDLLEERLNSKIKNIERKVDKFQDDKIEIAKIQRQLDDFVKQKNRIKIVENKPEFKPIVEKAKPEAIIYVDDCQKGRWQKNAEPALYKVKPDFLKKDEADEFYQLTLNVVPIEKETQLTGEVYYFLHDSYYPDCIQKTQAVNNMATISISSHEAFTLGVVCNDGNTKLEFDLNTYEGTPDDYKYSDRLMTQDELLVRLQDLKNEMETQEQESQNA